jgi:putative ABC transport system permease protein
MTIDRLLRIVALRVRTLFRRADVERDLDEELRYHLERQTEENVRQGMPRDAARAAALRALGGVEYRKEQVRDTRGTRWLEEFAGDVRFAVRGLRRSRGFSTAVILTLALGIGANTAMFTLLRGTLLRPLPNRDGGRLLYLRQSAPGAEQVDLSFSVPEVGDYRTARTLSKIAEYSQAVPFTLVGKDGHAVRAHVAVVTGNYFDVLGLDPAFGRLTSAHDDGAATAPVAVVSHRYWMEHFGGDSTIVGRVVRLNEKETTVVGVLQPAPDYPRPTDIFVNTVTSPHHLSATMVTDRNHRMSELFARLAPNATVGQARDELRRIAENMFRDHPDAYQKAAHFEISVTPLRDAMNERASLIFWLLMAAALFVLLIACANVANLTLMRGINREREMVVRAALGAGSARLRRLLLAENLTLALIGAAVGVVVAFAGLKLLVSFAAQFTPRSEEVRVDGLVLAVTLVTTVLVAIALSFVPRVGGRHAMSTSLLPTGGGRRTTLGRGRQRVQQSLVVAQIAVCMMLLTGAGLLARTIGKLSSVATGVRVDHLLTIDLPLNGDLLNQIMKQPQNLARYERIRDRVAALPGVQSATLSSSAPLRPGLMDMDVIAENHPIAPNQLTPHARYHAASPGYFATAGIPILAGREFASTDRRESPKVVILSRAFAQQLFGAESPIGKHVAYTGKLLKMSPFTDDWRIVVGVAGDTRDRGLENDVTPTIYEPYAQDVIVWTSLVVRTSSDPQIAQPMILHAIRDVEPAQIIDRVATVEQIRDEDVAPRRLNAMFITAFGALAFLIAMVGIAGVLAFSVSSRTSEIGIRMSLGADAARVRRMILGEGGVLLGAGLIVGFAGALFAARVLRGLLFGITPHDPATLAAVACALAAVGLAACWMPAARAARVDPAVALRAE